MLSYEQYRAMLPTMKHRLDDELEIYAEIMEQISSQAVLYNSRAIEAKDKLAKAEGLLIEEFKEDNPKLTVDQVNSQVRRHPDRAQAWRVSQEARAEYEKWSGLADAWRQKGYAIKNLADLYAAQYFALSDHQRKLDPNRSHLRSTRLVHPEPAPEPALRPAPERSSRRGLL